MNKLKLDFPNQQKICSRFRGIPLQLIVRYPFGVTQFPSGQDRWHDSFFGWRNSCTCIADFRNVYFLAEFVWIFNLFSSRAASITFGVNRGINAMFQGQVVHYTRVPAKGTDSYRNQIDFGR